MADEVDEKFIKDSWENITKKVEPDLETSMGEHNASLARKFLGFKPDHSHAAKYVFELYAYKAGKERADSSELQWRIAVFFSLAASAGVLLIEYLNLRGRYSWVEDLSSLGFALSLSNGIVILFYHRIRDLICGKPEGL